MTALSAFLVLPGPGIRTLKRTPATPAGGPIRHPTFQLPASDKMARPATIWRALSVRIDAFQLLACNVKLSRLEEPMITHSMNEIHDLVELTSSPCISIYMPILLPGRGADQNPIRLKNLERQAIKDLAKLGIGPEDAGELTRPIDARLTQGCWSDHHPAIGLFCAPAFFRGIDLSDACDELVVVGSHFHITPLLSKVSNDLTFYVLAIARNQVVLYEGNGGKGMTEVDVEGMPTSMAEALKYDNPEKQLQFHTGAANGSSGAHTVMYHGQGSGRDADKKKLLRFLQRVDRAVARKLKPGTRPLILAGVDYLLPIYEQANSYGHLHSKHILGNPEHLSPQQLFDTALEILSPELNSERERALAAYQQQAASPHTSTDVGEILKAAHLGRVETLFVVAGCRCWGSFDEEAMAYTFHDPRQPGDEDILNIVVLQSLRHGGKVYPLESSQMPDPHQPVAALYRF